MERMQPSFRHSQQGSPKRQKVFDRVKARIPKSIRSKVIANKILMIGEREKRENSGDFSDESRKEQKRRSDENEN